MADRVIICGSRKFWLKILVAQIVWDLPSDATVIVGGAKGPDQIAERVARLRGLDIEVFWPDWDKYGKSAGMRRNGEMLAANPTRITAFYDGSSRGTGMMIRESDRRDIPLELHESRRFTA